MSYVDRAGQEDLELEDAASASTMRDSLHHHHHHSHHHGRSVSEVVDSSSTRDRLSRSISSSAIGRGARASLDFIRRPRASIDYIRSRASIDFIRNPQTPKAIISKTIITCCTYHHHHHHHDHHTPPPFSFFFLGCYGDKICLKLFCVS